MMTSLLSTFDPSSNMMMVNWLSLVMMILIPISGSMWSYKSTVQQFFSFLTKELNLLFISSYKNELTFTSLFVFFFMINLMGLIPYGFSLSSHFSFNLSLGLTLWLSTMLWGLLKNLNSNIAHLTPVGCPMILVPFMVLVESISMIIRPITLSLRLMSNMLAGHMIISLICKACFDMIWVMKTFFFLLNIFFLFFELAVALIQTYVFTMLSNLYWKDTE